MNYLNKIFHLLFWGVFIFFVFSISIIFTFNLLPNLHSDFIRGGIMAFFGAFFAFIFVKFAEYMTIRRKGNVNHINGLVKIERLLNKVITRLEENILVFHAHKKVLESKGMLILSSHVIPINDELMDDLKNIDFINDYFDFTVDIETLNNDLITLKSTYEEIKHSFLNKIITQEIYQNNISYCIKELENLLKYMTDYQEKAIQLTAKTRLLLKEKKNLNFLFGFFPKKKYIKGFDKLVEEETKILEKEIKECREKSEKEKKLISESKREGTERKTNNGE